MLGFMSFVFDYFVSVGVCLFVVILDIQNV